MLIEHKPLQDPVIVEELFSIVAGLRIGDVAIDGWNTNHHIGVFQNWLLSGTTTTIVGLDDFKYAALCVGASDVIDAFINRNSHRRIRFSCAEFVLSKIICNSTRTDWLFIEDAPLASNDAVILSLPFSGNGGIHANHDNILDTCAKLDIPVCMDLAYVGIAHNLHIDLTAKCITDVTTSLSKPFSVMLRHGVRFSRNYVDDKIQYISDRGMLPRINVATASQLMQKFTKDYVVNKYLSKYSRVCKQLKLNTTNTITLALGNNQQHKEFLRGGYNRICVTDEILA